MDRLRRSLRSSIRRKKNKDKPDGGAAAGAGGGSAGSSGGDSGGKSGKDGKPNIWKQDEISVRSGTCSFSVKVRKKRENNLSRFFFSNVCGKLMFARRFSFPGFFLPGFPGKESILFQPFLPRLRRSSFLEIPSVIFVAAIPLFLLE